LPHRQRRPALIVKLDGEARDEISSAIQSQNYRKRARLRICALFLAASSTVASPQQTGILRNIAPAP
jgi:hypothetical protein